MISQGRRDLDGHQRWFGFRGLVEPSDNLRNIADHGDIETPTKRWGRGYAAIYLALTYAVVAFKLRRIAAFIR